jgi:hypothetical protein
MNFAEKVIRAKTDYDAVYDAGYEKGKSAFGVINKESGTVVRADNVNENEHIVKVGLSSKNKLPFPYKDGDTQVKKGVTFTANADCSITINGTPDGSTAGYSLYVNKTTQNLIEKGKTYTLSLFNNPLKSNIFIGSNTSTDGVNWDASFGRTLGAESVTITVTEEFKGIQLYINVPASAGTLENVTVYPQLEEGTTATPYTPYVADVTSANVTACGVNMFDLGYMAENYKGYSATYTDNSFSFTGTDNGAYLIAYIPQNFYVTGNITISGMGGWRIVIRTYDNKGNCLKNSYPIKIISGSSSYAYLDFYQGYYYDVTKDTDGNFALKITVPKEVAYFQICFVLNKQTYTYTNFQVEVGHTASDYESYNGTTHTPNADGTLEIPSISPTTTLTTDKQGVNIECEYYLDGQAVIDELTDAIISLGGTI